MFDCPWPPSRANFGLVRRLDFISESAKTKLSFYLHQCDQMGPLRRAGSHCAPARNGENSDSIPATQVQLRGVRKACGKATCPSLVVRSSRVIGPLRHGPADVFIYIVDRADSSNTILRISE